VESYGIKNYSIEQDGTNLSSIFIEADSGQDTIRN